MSWLIWNIRGVHQKESIDHLNILLRQQATSFLVLMEPKVSYTEIHRLVLKPLYAVDPAITVKIMVQGQLWVVTSLVYANILKRLRRTLWYHLSWVGQNMASPWLIAGDFNVITNMSKKDRRAGHRYSGYSGIPKLHFLEWSTGSRIQGSYFYQL